MNFIKKTKTNWKYILIVFILAALVSGGILYLTGRQDISPSKIFEITQPEESKNRRK